MSSPTRVGISNRIRDICNQLDGDTFMSNNKRERLKEELSRLLIDRDKHDETECRLEEDKRQLEKSCAKESKVIQNSRK